MMPDRSQDSPAAASPRAAGSEPRVLFCVGAQKAGTTWLYRYLDAHPECHVPPIKEMHYFDGLYGPERSRVRSRRASDLDTALARQLDRKTSAPLRYRAETLYRWVQARLGTNRASLALLREHSQMFDPGDRSHGRYWDLLTRNCGTATVVADITPSYAVIGRGGYREMLRRFPDARFQFILRDPVDRLWSALRMRSSSADAEARGATDPVEIAEKWASRGLPPHVERRCQYARTVANLDAVVPQDQLLYQFYETGFTPRAVRELTGFIGVSYRAADFDKVVFRGQKLELPNALRRRLRKMLAPQYDAMRERFRDRLPQAWTEDQTAGVTA